MRAKITCRYVVYGLMFNDNYVFYIGKGTEYRPAQHITEARSGHPCPKCAVIRHALSRGMALRHRIFCETDDNNYALWAEMRAIGSYPYGALCNLWGGGSRSYTAEVVKRDVNLWEAMIYQITSPLGAKEEIYSEMGDTRIEAQKRIAKKYDPLILPEYLPRLTSKPKKIRGV